MTDYTKLVKALRDIEKTMFALGTSPINMDNVSIRLAYDKRWGPTAKDAADAIERITAMYEKAEMDATNLTGKLAQAEADIDRLNLEIDKRIATEIELSKSLDAANYQLKMYSMRPFDDEEEEEEYEINHIPAASPWHRVEEELPSMDGYDWVLGIVTGEAGYLRFHKAVMMVSFDPQYKEWFIDEYPDAKITVSHWMELPEPPKEDA